MAVADTEPVFVVGALSILAAAGFEAMAADMALDMAVDTSGDGLVEGIVARRPAAVLLDSGVGARPYAADVVAALAARVPETAVVVVVRRAQSTGMVESMEAGARALVHRQCAPAELVAAVSAAVDGQNWVAAPLAGILRSELLTEVSGARPPALSRRELEILRVLVTGATNAEIGRRLAISEHTVRNHVHSLTRKLAVANRTDAVAVGLRRGLVDLPD